MTTTRMRGLVLGVLLASCAALPATASAQATSPTLSTTTTCIDPQAQQNVDFSVTGLSATAHPVIEMTGADDFAEISFSGGDVTPDASGNASGTLVTDPVTYGQLAEAGYGDGAGVWLKLREPTSYELFAQLRIPLCGADSTPPALALSDVTADATSASGAAVSFTATATDDVDGSVPVTCDRASGSTFALGTTTVNCSATDAAGNAAQGTFTVTVRAPDLSTLLARFGFDAAAWAHANNRCNALGATENQIRARTGKTLTRAQSEQLLAATRATSALLRCR